MRRPAYWPLVEKSRAACLAAIETYNRASVQYREETFAILMINAWELLFKARVMKENGGKVASLHAFRWKKRKDGSAGRQKEYRYTQSGLHFTISVHEACAVVRSYENDPIDDNCVRNIDALVEIRDSAVHFVANNVQLRKTLAEISMASVRNYVIAAQKWFDMSFADLNIAIIPVSFDLDQAAVEAVARKPGTEVAQFLKHMQGLERESDKHNSQFSFAVKVTFDLMKKKDAKAILARLAMPGETAEVVIGVDEDAMPAGFDWSYNELLARLKKRYKNFKCNKQFLAMMKELKDDRSICFARYIDPRKKNNSTPRRFYNPNILQRLDKYYVLKEAKAENVALAKTG